MNKDTEVNKEIKQKLKPICTRFRQENLDKDIVKQMVEEVYQELENYI